MRILYFSQLFINLRISLHHSGRPSIRVSGVRESHDVTVFTGWPNYPVGRLSDGYEMKPLVEGID